jgi:predicted pyridoxine 5'-phosphate oxidase superfamily flavin-nucleotide-binding protein
MASQENSGAVGFHKGELGVQRRSGVAAQAARLSGMLARGELRGGFARFLADRTFAVLTARDADGRLWTSPLSGLPGFLEPTGTTTLSVHAVPGPGDPLHNLVAEQPVGLVAIEFATRGRVRVNGTLSTATGTGFRVDVEQAYGNCPQYIQQRVLTPDRIVERLPTVRSSERLDAEDIALIRGADTFFIGTTHPTRGADASHRGGPAGFVRVHDGELWWPDYTGNNMFNTLGNLAVDPSAALLFPDFRSGRAVQLSGTARVEWMTPGAAGDDDATGRLVRFTPDQVVAGRTLGVHAEATVSYDDNPPLSGGPQLNRTIPDLKGPR